MLGLNFKACLISNSSLLCAVSTSAEKRFELAAITSKACVPMEPVEPNTAIRFLFATAMRSVSLYNFVFNRFGNLEPALLILALGKRQFMTIIALMHALPY